MWWNQRRKSLECISQRLVPSPLHAVYGECRTSCVIAIILPITCSFGYPHVEGKGYYRARLKDWPTIYIPGLQDFGIYRTVEKYHYLTFILGLLINGVTYIVIIQGCEQFYFLYSVKWRCASTDVTFTSHVLHFGKNAYYIESCTLNTSLLPFWQWQ